MPKYSLPNAAKTTATEQLAESNPFVMKRKTKSFDWCKQSNDLPSSTFYLSKYLNKTENKRTRSLITITITHRTRSLPIERTLSTVTHSVAGRFVKHCVGLAAHSDSLLVKDTVHSEEQRLNIIKGTVGDAYPAHNSATHPEHSFIIHNNQEVVGSCRVV